MDRTIRVYDCSNSSERPANRGFGGNVENAVVTMLKKYGPSIGVLFVDSITDCDVIFTNDVFPQNTWMSQKPKVKRMDGIFQEPKLRDRNIPYVKSCQMADHIIFISKYSFDCFHSSYGDSLYQVRPTAMRSVILNWVDEDIFYPVPREKTVPTNYVAVATSWARPEKGLSRLLRVAKLLGPKETLYLVGTMPDDTELPPNVKSLGYMSELRLANTLREMDVLINASENDAAPKVIPEAICCGLTILCYHSGGCVEFLSGNIGTRVFGYCFYDNSDITGLIREMRYHWRSFVDTSYSHWNRGERRTEDIVNSYARVFRSLVK